MMAFMGALGWKPPAQYGWEPDSNGHLRVYVLARRATNWLYPNTFFKNPLVKTHWCQNLVTSILIISKKCRRCYKRHSYQIHLARNPRYYLGNPLSFHLPPNFLRISLKHFFELDQDIFKIFFKIRVEPRTLNSALKPLAQKAWKLDFIIYVVESWLNFNFCYAHNFSFNCCFYFFTRLIFDFGFINPTSFQEINKWILWDISVIFVPTQLWLIHKLK